MIDSIGGMLNLIGQMTKTQLKKEFCYVLLGKDNGILMETIGISVMASIVFFSRGVNMFFSR